MSNTPTRQREYSIETTATPEAVWTLFRDVRVWRPRQ